MIPADPVSATHAAGRPAAAFFDVDGTLVHATVLHYYAWLVRRTVPEPARSLRLAWLALRIPWYLWLDRRGRDHFLRAFYRNYAGYRPETLARLQGALFAEVIRRRLRPEGEAAVRVHRAAGRRVVILSASLPFVLEPLAAALGADDVIAQELEVADGRYTGRLAGPPLNGMERARRLQEYAAAHGLDPAACYAYGDSPGDLPMLAAVGHPVVVNPSRHLRRAAERRGWEVARWGMPDGGGKGEG